MFDRLEESNLKFNAKYSLQTWICKFNLRACHLIHCIKLDSSSMNCTAIKISPIMASHKKPKLSVFFMKIKVHKQQNFVS